MQGAQTDFHLTIDRAAGLLLDATCACRAAVAGPLPMGHRAVMRRAIGKLESAQTDLWKARNDPWASTTLKERQLALL